MYIFFPYLEFKPLPQIHIRPSLYAERELHQKHHQVLQLLLQQWLFHQYCILRFI